jgi:hypothetical protein
MAPPRAGATAIRSPGDGGGSRRGRGLGGPSGGPLDGPPGGPPGGPLGGPGRSPSLSRSPSPSGSHNGGGNGGGLGGGLAGGLGGAQPGGGALQPPLAYNTAAQFLGMWNNCATDVARQHLEQQAISRSQVAEVQIAAMVKINLRLQMTVGRVPHLELLYQDFLQSPLECKS